MRYVISYDLNQPGQDYSRLINELQRYGAKKVLMSQWGLRRRGTTAAALRDHFWQFMDRNDRLLVICTDNNNWAGMNLINKLSDI